MTKKDEQKDAECSGMATSQWDFAFRSFLHGNERVPLPQCHNSTQEIASMMHFIILSGASFIFPSLFSDQVSVDSSSVPSTFESQPRASAADCPSGATVQLGCGDGKWWVSNKMWTVDDLKIFEDTGIDIFCITWYLNEPSFQRMFLNYHVFILYFFIFFCIFSVQMIWWICKQHFLRSWFGINQLNTPFGKNWLPRESSQQESVFESKPQQSKVQQTTSLTMVSHL